MAKTQNLNATVQRAWEKTTNQAGLKQIDTPIETRDHNNYIHAAMIARTAGLVLMTQVEGDKSIVLTDKQILEFSTRLLTLLRIEPCICEQANFKKRLQALGLLAVTAKTTTALSDVAMDTL